MRHRYSLLFFLLALDAGVQAQEPLAVTTSPMAQVVIYPHVDLPAQALALNDSQLAAQISTTVAQISVRVGEHVAEGQALLSLEEKDHRIALEQAQASLRNVTARLDLARYRLSKVDALLARNSISEDDAKQRATEAASLESDREAQAAAVDRAKVDLSRCKLRAPFAGVITARLVSVGEWVAPGTPLLRLVSDEELELSARVQLSDVDELAGAAEVTFHSAGRDYPVRLRAITGVVGESDRLREARFLFLDAAPLPGQSGTLRFRKPSPHLPPGVLVRRAAVLGYFEAVSGKALFRPLPGVIEGQPAPVNNIDGRLVVIDGRQKLQDGAPIMTAQ